MKANWTKVGQSMLAKQQGKKRQKRRAITGWKLKGLRLNAHPTQK